MSRAFAAIGCWITVLALLVDPFAQQIISYRETVVYSQNNSTYIPYASRWSAAEDQVSFVGLLNQTVGNFGDVLSEPRPHLNFTTQAAIINGISMSASEISQQMPVGCNSGTCEWETYNSLDIHPPFYRGWRITVDQAGWFGDPQGVYEEVNETFFVIPDGLNMNNPVNYSYGQGSTERITMSGQANWDPNSSITFKNSSTLLFSMSIMWADLDRDYKFPDWSNSNVSAVECGLYLCVKEFNSSLQNGTLNETSREVAATREIGSYQQLDQPAEDSLKIYPLYDMGTVNTSLQLSDLQIQRPANTSSSNTTQPAFFNISAPGVRGLMWYLSYTFDDRSMWNKIPNLEQRTIDLVQLMPNVTGLVRLIENTTTFEFWPDIMQVFWTAHMSTTQSGMTGFETLFTNVATSLTNNLRMTADNNTRVYGVEGVTTTFIRIRWLWAILPCATIVLSAAFLLVTVTATQRTDTPLWKNSTLPILFHGFGDQLRKTVPRNILSSEMVRDAKGINVELVDGAEGFELEGTTLIAKSS
ncbi:MAG: hypothetical protein M1821_006138 [Bathelium mastoideum]|nr:MAG: hypothetical protein M1821_006138 [Bathelium mastoideum]